MKHDFRKTEAFNGFLERGKDVEKLFAKECLIGAIFATKEQDQMEHWVVCGVCKKISNKQLKFDVKSQKKNNRNDKQFSSELTWIEGKNVYGYDGWIKGKSDYIAFERERIWLIVNRALFLASVEAQYEPFYQHYRCPNAALPLVLLIWDKA